MIEPVFIKATTLDDVYFKLLSELYKYGREIPVDEGSYKGSTRLEFDYVSGFIKYPTVRPLAPITPEGVDPVTTDEKIEEYFLDYLMNTKLGENEHYKYSTWIAGGEYKIPALSLPCWKRKNEYWVIAPDQLQWCIDHYREKGFGNNHCYIQVGYPESNYAYDMPYESEADRGTSPCLRGIDTKIIDNKLCFHVYFRSWDLYSAFPQNMGGITLLLEYMAEMLEIEVGILFFSSLKLHCYKHAIIPMKRRSNIE